VRFVSGQLGYRRRCVDHDRDRTEDERGDGRCTEQLRDFHPPKLETRYGVSPGVGRIVTPLRPSQHAGVPDGFVSGPRRYVTTGPHTGRPANGR
jgi:hypothetical protein